MVSVFCFKIIWVLPEDEFFAFFPEVEEERTCADGMASEIFTVFFYYLFGNDRAVLHGEYGEEGGIGFFEGYCKCAVIICEEALIIIKYPGAGGGGGFIGYSEKGIDKIIGIYFSSFAVFE
jgi:hypothetical protein